jgi:hypothetical protein
MDDTSYKQKRENVVQSRMKDILNRVREESRPKKVDGSKQLAAITAKIDEVERNVESFEGFHFTKVYRTLHGDFTKLQIDLDNLDWNKNEGFRHLRNVQSLRIDKLADWLNSKTHARTCPLCEVQD